MDSCYLPCTDVDWRWEPSFGVFGAGACQWVLYSTSGDLRLGHLARVGTAWGFVVSEAFGAIARSQHWPQDDGWQQWPTHRRKRFAELFVSDCVKAAFGGL